MSFPPSASLPALLLDRAATTPNAPALLLWDPNKVLVDCLSYAALARSMLAAAAWLREEVGLREGALLPLLAENSACYLAITLGGMSVGAASLHLNWRQPPAVSAELLRSLGATLLVASPHLRADANEDGRVSRAEFLERDNTLFNRLDADENGVVTPEELDAAVEQRRERREDRRRWWRN